MPNTYRVSAEIIGGAIVATLHAPDYVRTETGNPLQFLGADGSVQYEVGDEADSVNHFVTQGGRAGGGPVLAVVGEDADVDANYAAKGAGGHYHGNGRGALHAILDGSGGIGGWINYPTTKASAPGLPVVWMPQGDEMHIPAVFGPKGQAYLSAQEADAAVTGGNVRGIYSTDLQRARSAATQVASGDSAAILGGRNNTASGAYAQAGGDTCLASGWASFAFGSKCDATATLSRAGGQCALANARGKDAFTGSQFSNARGSAQASRQTLQAATSDATQTMMTAGAEALSATSSIALQNNSALAAEIVVVGRSITGAVVAMFKADALWSRDSNAASSVLEHGNVVAVSNPGGWSVALGVDTTFGCGLVKVTGAGSTLIRWVAEVCAVELTY